jgi:hypothetical protein
MQELLKRYPDIQITEINNVSDKQVRRNFRESMIMLIEGAVLGGLDLPARLALDGDFRIGDSVVRHPDVLLHAVDGLHAQQHQPARAVSGGRRAG